MPNEPAASPATDSHAADIQVPSATTDAVAGPSAPAREPTQDADSYTPEAPKAPTKKATDKSLKRSKAAPALLPTVLSKTRQQYLPPKPREEDNKHLKEYIDMLRLAQEAETKRQERLQAAKTRRDAEAQAHQVIWEKEIVPNWKVVRGNAKLTQIWWSGTMPARYRANLWTACIGNALAISRSSFTKSLALANSYLSTNRLPSYISDLIEQDIALTLPQTKLFQGEGPMAADLKNMLLAYSVFWKEKPSYSTGVSFLAALLLISMPVQEAFISLVNLVNNSLLKYFYEDKQDYIDAYDRIFGTLLADHMPEVYHNFIAHDVRPSLYLHPWVRAVYAYHLPLDCATRIMDVVVLEGDSFLFRTGLALLQTMEARLFNPDKAELAELFRAEDKGAKSVVMRYKGYDEEGWNGHIYPDEVYTQCGADEERLFQALSQIQWKDSAWTRLVERELPD